MGTPANPRPPVTDEEMTRLAKAFNRDKVEVRSEGYLNNLELRYANEPARHKLLDIVGDLALIGYPIKARIIANRPGHSTNVEFAKKIKQYIKKNNKSINNVPTYDPNIPPIYNINDIAKTLPHRYPFLMVDKVIEMTDSYIVATKNVTFNEPMFQGHFPNNPIMPGVLQLEALAQAGGIFVIKSIFPPGTYDTYFVKINNCKFKFKILPGDTMILKMVLTEPVKRGMCYMTGTVYVNGKVASEAEMVAQVVRVGD